MSMPIALVIDDNSVLRQFIRFTLESKGWMVAEAQDPHEGLEVFRQVRPQLITLDLIMPINKGLDAVQLARQIHDEDPEVTVLVVSGIAPTQDVKDLFARRGLEVFDKPSGDKPTFDKLFARIDTVFRELSH
jgi:two-component system, chemotaxis family, chemotaxis protein CheY